MRVIVRVARYPDGKGAGHLLVELVLLVSDRHLVVLGDVTEQLEDHVNAATGVRVSANNFTVLWER